MFRRAENQLARDLQAQSATGFGIKSYLDDDNSELSVVQNASVSTTYIGDMK